MPQLTPDQKRAITSRLGYRLAERPDDERRDLVGPDGRHRGVFRPSRATDLWIWNDAVFSFELYRDREGAVHRASPASPGSVRLERIWPEPGETSEAPARVLDGYERLSASQSI